MNKNLNFILLIIIAFTNLKAIDPLSRIEITSDKATAQKSNDYFYLSYIDNVKVKFADLTRVEAENLKVKIDYTKNKKDKIENLKEIILEKNILIIKQNLRINSDKAVIDPSQKICKLYGNVIIEQIKRNAKDVPILTKCDSAKLNLVTEKLELQGSKIKPINTIIRLENHN